VGCDETGYVLRVDVRGLLGDGTDAGKARTFFEARAKLRELLGRANSVGFNTAVAAIADVASEAQALGFGDGEEAEADSLHKAGDEEAGCFFCGVHKL
jgi:hypothetical protein